MKPLTTPDRWILLKIGNIYKVFGSWSGSYLHGDSWRINSGIESVEDDGDFWLFHGVSGSVYKCRKTSYGTTGYSSMVLTMWMDQNKDIEVVDGGNFDFMGINDGGEA